MATETKEEVPAPSTYNIRPSFEEKFRPSIVKECIRLVLVEELGGKSYESEDAPMWTKTIADTVQTKVKELGYERYKFIIQVIIGEQRGEGVKMGSRCLWDADTDNFASEIFNTESLFCVVAVFATYYY